MQRTEQYLEIEAPVGRVFDLFSDFESLPRWMENIARVVPRGRRFTHWVADAPRGASLEWDAEIIAFEQDRRIAWRSVGGDVETLGEAVFDEVRPGVTLMRVRLAYDPPRGRLGAVVTDLFGENPARQLAADLRRFRRMAETRPRPRRVEPAAGYRRDDQAGVLLRRGVDRLLDKAPSGRWPR